ncbi:MAG: hypothetical protein U9P38_05435 [Campylobacterota bacterium]|nr:hypothetical protein [Campylobacterota bacterium]
MLNNITTDKQFAGVMQKNIEGLITHFFKKEQNFGILCSIDHVSFEPELPEDINSEFRDLTLFFLGGYTFETAHITDNYLIFEAGFGADNFGSIVHVPLLAILQIIVEETPVLINLAQYQEEEEIIEDQTDNKGVESSMASFLSNPENSKFVK